MATLQVSDEMALAIASSVNFPSDFATSGMYVVYQDKRYLLTIRNGKYIAWDISVYADNGNLVTGAFDVYLEALKQVPGEIVKGLDTSVNILIVGAVIVAGLYLYNTFKK